MMRLRVVALLSLVGLLSQTLSGQNGSQGVQRPADTPLYDSLQLALIQETPQEKFRVELRNMGEQDLILNLGMMLGNGRRQYADKVDLFLKDSHGQHLHLHLAGPAAINGRIDPMVVPLPSHGMFTLAVDLHDYIAPEEKIWKLELVPGQYTVSAEYTGVGVPQRGANLDMQGVALMPYWNGTLHSNTLTFTEVGGGQSQPSR